MPPKHIPLPKELRAKRCSNRSKVFFFDPEFPEKPWHGFRESHFCLKLEKERS